MDSSNNIFLFFFVNLKMCVDSRIDMKEKEEEKSIINYIKNYVSGERVQVTSVMCHVLRVVCHLSPVACH